jgi:hypothetical protein
MGVGRCCAAASDLNYSIEIRRKGEIEKVLRIQRASLGFNCQRLYGKMLKNNFSSI